MPHATRRPLAAAFPDPQPTVGDLIAEGDPVAARPTSRGTHRGAFVGVAPPGKPATQTGIDVLHLAGRWWGAGASSTTWACCSPAPG
jgi:predicted ester cyclase